jgi:hypothetical protein
MGKLDEDVLHLEVTALALGDPWQRFVLETGLVRDSSRMTYTSYDQSLLVWRKHQELRWTTNAVSPDDDGRS